MRDVWKGRYTDDFESYIVKLQKVLLKEKRKKVGVREREEFEDGLFKLSIFLSFQGYFKKRVERVKRKLRKVAKSKVGCGYHLNCFFE